MTINDTSNQSNRLASNEGNNRRGRIVKAIEVWTCPECGGMTVGHQTIQAHKWGCSIPATIPIRYIRESDAEHMLAGGSPLQDGGSNQGEG